MEEVLLYLVSSALGILVVVAIFKTAVLVPQQQAYIVEFLGRYRLTLSAGFHILWPFFDKVTYRHTLKEQAIDIPEQICITRDNVQVGVDGVIYIQVLDPARASYGIDNYQFAVSQLAQTTLRSEMGKIELDKTFEERSLINASIVEEIDKASASWGVKILRYEIMNISPPPEVLSSMEKQMKAEREKRAIILESEAVRESEINRAEGDKQKVIKASEALRVKQINEAEGQAQAILAVAEATAQGLERVARALANDCAGQAMELRVAEQYLESFGNIAKESNTVVLPANLADVGSMLKLATSLVKS